MEVKNYWKENISFILKLLVVWFVVSFGCGILLLEYLNQFEFSGVKLGFFFAQQGSIYIFVLLIFIYSYRMNKLDEKYNLKH